MRFLLGLLIVLALIAVFTRARGPRRALAVVVAVLVIYAILKVTGVIEAIAPDRIP